VKSPEKSAEAVASGIQILDSSLTKIVNSSLSAPIKQIVLDALNGKKADFYEALNALLGISFIAIADNATATPGEKEFTTLQFFNRGKETVTLKGINLQAPGKIAAADSNPAFGDLPPEGAARFRYGIEIALDAQTSEPFWYLPGKGSAHYRYRQTEDPLAPFGNTAVSAQAIYGFRNIEVPVKAVARAQAGDSIRGADFVDFQITPALSVSLKPELLIMPQPSESGTRTIQATLLNNRKESSKGIFKLDTPQGWTVKPLQVEFSLSRKGEAFTQSFTIAPPVGLAPGKYSIQAVATINGQEFRKEQQRISYPENWTRYLYAPTQTVLEMFPITIAPNLKVGYIAGAGDDILAALQQLGVRTQLLTADDLAFGDLQQFSSIITGIRAYNENDALRKNNQRLLDYVSEGGTLIVQYVRPMGMASRTNGGSPFLFSPYPMSISNDSRITVEDSPVRILNAAHSLFNQPNKIEEADFQGWVQERGLYFMNSWDPHFEALLSGNDPGESPQNGGMLYARFGKGHYIYTGYSWFRQLPAGVPGAYRIFANMLSIGASK
jgi:hypothetical protein